MQLLQKSVTAALICCVQIAVLACPTQLNAMVAAADESVADDWDGGYVGYWGTDPAVQAQVDIENMLTDIRRINDLLISQGKISPLPADAWDWQRWINNTYDNNDDGPATITTKCAWIVQALMNALKFDPTFAVPPGVKLEWLEYNVPPVYHSVIAISYNGTFIGSIDPWRQDFTPRYDWGWDTGIWTPGVEWIIVPRDSIVGPAVAPNN